MTGTRQGQHVLWGESIVATKRTSGFKALFGCLAAAGIAWAGLSIFRQLNPPPIPGAQAAESPPRPRGGAWQERQQRLLAKMEGAAKRIAGPKAKIVPAHLAWQGAAGRGGLLEDIDGCLPAGPGIDVVWNRGQLYLMKKKGRLDRVFTANDNNDKFRPSDAGGTCVCFDGRYVWAALWRFHKTPLLIVLDPQSGQTWPLGVGEGLPIENDPRSQPSSFVIGPVAPGKACIAVHAAPARIALVDFDPKTGAKFATLSLDKLAPPKDATSPLELSELRTGIEQAFHPVAIFNLAPPGDASSQRIAISCVGNRTAFCGPLLIAPQTRSIEATASDASSMAVNNSRVLSVAGSIYWTEQTNDEPAKFALVRARAPKLDEEFVFDEIPEGHPIAYNDRIAFLGDECWLWKPGERQIESLDVQVPWLYQPFGKPESLLPVRKIAGEEWALKEVFASQHYGVLAKARKFIRPNGGASKFLLFQFALADDPRIESESPPAAADRPQWAVKLPPGTAASELRIFAPQGDGRRPLAGFGKVVEVEPDDKFRYPILAREIVRQALLIAARDQLQWTTRDETLSESIPSANEQVAAKWVLETRFPYAGQTELTLRRVESDGKASDVWKEQIALNADDSHPFDYAALVASAERWSRETFPSLLKQGELSGEPNPASDDADVSPAAAEWLKQMTFTAQFAVLRELHHAIRKHGESAALLGALSRAYANLGVLSEFHWNSMHEACKARALLYAERLIAREPQSPQALWHRAYVKGLIGLHDSAVADLDAAVKLVAAAGGEVDRPQWLEVVDAYCRFDIEKLAATEKEDAEYAQLAGALHFFLFEGLKESAAVQTLAQRLMEENPECFRLYDAMCDSCALGTLHVATQMAPAVLHRTVPSRLQQLSGLPKDAAELLKRAAIRDVSLTEVAESLLQTPPEDDAGEFSWRILGRMVQEVEFIQLWRRVFFMRFQWAVPSDEFISAIDGVAAGHRYRPLIELCSTDAGRWQAAAETLTGRLELEELDYAQFLAFSKGLGDAWKTRWTEQYVQAERRPGMHADDVHRDLLVSIEQEGFSSPETLSERLMRVSSNSPDAVAANVLQHHFAPDELAALERKFPRHPQVLKLLARMSAEPEVHKRRLRAYIKLSPDAWAYRMLAEAYRLEGDLDQWKAVLDECLTQPEFGLEHSQLRVQIANQYMDQGEWEKARPYAAEAAESWAEWAMLCAIRCYVGLGDDEQEGLWRSRIVERYPKTQHWLDYYVWARRTGDAQAESLLKTVDPMVAAAAPQIGAESQYLIGLFYQLSKRPKEALAAYRKGAEGHLDLRHKCFDSLWMAAVASELGDAEGRDQALDRVAKLSEPSVASFRRLAEWLQACWRLSKEQQPDLEAARQIAAAAEAKDRTGVNCFVGRALELRGQFDAAVEFYQAAVEASAGRASATHDFVCAVLRDRGIEPGAGEHEAEPAANQPAKAARESK